MFECLTGVIPYPKNSDAAVLYAHLSDEPPLVTDQRPELPPALDEVIARAMAKDPAARHQTASEFVSEAERAFGKRVRAVITPPGPVEAPEEAGIRPDEANVPTRETRLRDAPDEGGSAESPAADPTRAAKRPPADPTRVSDPGGPGAADEAGDAAVAPADATRAAVPAPADVTRAAVPAPVDVTRAAVPAPTAPADVTRASSSAAPDATRRRPARAARDEDVGARRAAAGPLLAATLAVVAVVAGLLVGGSGGDGDGTPAQLPNIASTGDVGVRYPSGWSRSAARPEIPGLEVDGGVALEAGTPAGAQVLLGKIAGSGPTLLPASFTEKLEHPPSGEDRVRLSDGVEAYRYAGLTPAGFGGKSLTLFVVPTTAGAAALACVAPPAAAAAFRPDCERVASTLELTGARALPLGPSTSYAQGLDRMVRGLNRARTRLRARLRDARRPGGQARSADQLARAYSAALAALPDAPGPAEQRAHAAIRDALASTRDAYERMSASAQGGDSAGFGAARESVQSGERAFQRALAALEPLGYSIS